MIAALVLGAVVGLGVFFVVHGLFPRRPSLADALDALRARPEPAPVVLGDVDVEPDGFAARIGRPLAHAARRLGRGDLLLGPVRRDLGVLDRSPERQLAEKMTAAIFGLCLPLVLSGLVALGGHHVPIVLPVWGAVLLGVVGFFLPDAGIHSDANARRAEFRHGLSAYLDLVVIALAAGGGIETALADAAEVGDGFAFVRLRRCLDDARIASSPPAVAFGRLGEELGVDELVELASSLALAGSEGAKVRSSIQAKASSMRVHELSGAESIAQAATERMSLPMVFLLIGFFLLIGYPAFSRIGQGL